MTENNQEFIGTKIKSVCLQTDPDCITLCFEDKNYCHHLISFKFKKMLWETFQGLISDDFLGHYVKEFYLVKNQFLAVTLDNGRKIKLGEEETVNNIVKLNELFEKD